MNTFLPSLLRSRSNIFNGKSSISFNTTWKSSSQTHLFRITKITRVETSIQINRFISGEGWQKAKGEINIVSKMVLIFSERERKAAEEKRKHKQREYDLNHGMKPVVKKVEGPHPEDVTKSMYFPL